MEFGITALMVLNLSFSCAQEKIKLNHDHSQMELKQTPLEFIDKNFTNAYAHYKHIKNGLVGSNPGEAQKGAEMLNKALNKVANADAALSASQKIAATDDLMVQRKAFLELSNQMEALLREKITTGKLYKDFCPITLNGGAYWLSSIKDIRNPYYGEQMLGWRFNGYLI